MRRGGGVRSGGRNGGGAGGRSRGDGFGEDAGEGLLEGFADAVFEFGLGIGAEAGLAEANDAVFIEEDVGGEGFDGEALRDLA